MPWHYRDPMTFPGVFHSTIKSAVRLSPEPVLLASVPTKADARLVQAQLRHFKWCCQHERSAAAEIRGMLKEFSIRASVESRAYVHLIYLTARPTLVAEILSLNPRLASDLSGVVNS